MKIGVFDSGLGGRSVAAALIAALPEHEIIFRDDRDNLPYGSKTPDQLRSLVEPHLRHLENVGCEIIVVACNTVSCTILPELVGKYSAELVGIVPMIKPASKATASKIVAVCATPATLASPRYDQLKNEFGAGIQFLEPDCSDWAFMIETSTIDQQKVEDTIDEVCSEGADVIVLGCTHYHWIQDIIQRVAKGRAQVIQPENAIVNRVKSLIARLQ